MRHRPPLLVSAIAAAMDFVVVIRPTAWWQDSDTSPTSQSKQPSDVPLQMGMTYLPLGFPPASDTPANMVSGVLITKVTSEGLANQSGIEAGDIVL